jgi:hypothetical protein
MWKFSNQGDAQGAGREPLMLESELGREGTRRFCQAVPLSQIIVPLVIEAEGSFDDMPWTGQCLFAGSDRLREVVERDFPGHAQFLPTSIRYEDGRPFTAVRYWAINWLHEVDCIDWKRSRYSRVEGSEYRNGGFWRFDQVVVDPDKVPERIHVFRLKEFEEMLIITERGRRLLEASGVTGCQYYNVH